MAHASDNTPDPITAVMICALAVNTVPTSKTKTLQIFIHCQINQIRLKKKQKPNDTCSFGTTIIVVAFGIDGLIGLNVHALNDRRNLLLLLIMLIIIIVVHLTAVLNHLAGHVKRGTKQEATS